MTQNATLQITDHADRSRFEAHLGGAPAGRLDYHRSPGRIDFTHTVVNEAYAGRGVGSTLVREALDAVRAEGGVLVIPTCPYVKGWIDKHPDYADLLA